MKNVGKKLCVFLLVAVMIVSLLPAAAFAASEGKVTYKLVFNGVQGKTGALKCTRPAGHELIPGDLFVTGLNVTGLWKDFENYFGGTEEGVESATLEKMHQYWEENPVNGYIFKGWFDAAEGGNEIGPGHVVQEGERLYAHAVKAGVAVEAKPVETEELLEAAGSVQTFAMAMAMSVEPKAIVTKADIDAILAAGMEDVNAKMMAKDKGYAKLVANSDGNGFTVEMYKPDYKIVGSDSNVYNDIIGTLVEHLNKAENKAKVKTLKGEGISETIDLTADRVEAASVAAFAKALVMSKVTQLQPAGPISQLNGKTYTIIIVDVNDEAYSYTITFTTKAEGYQTTEEEIDAIIEDGIKASNAAMDNNGKPYAELSELNENNEVTVLMHDPNYPIKKDGNDVYTNIIGVLVNKLFENRGKVTSIAAVKNGNAETMSPGLITLDNLTGVQDTDASTVVQFILKLGLKGENGGNLKPDQGIGQLDGQSFQVEVTGKGTEPVKVTYTVKFELKVELVLTPDAEKEENGAIKLTQDEKGAKTLTGTDLVATGKAQGATADTVIKKFEDVAGSYEVKVVDKDDKDIDKTAPVGTGSKVQLLKGNEVVDEITIIVKGDTDGDGKINNVDAQYILDQVIGDGALKDEFEVAAHMQGPETKLSHLDAQMILDLAANVAN